ncbi:MAG: TIGR03905 family TSCPD domain-containing protein [Clostridiales bacterium]|nr:TIGR03905 family TSCPD domain-containing protein [Clostridiales bacterium]
MVYKTKGTCSQAIDVEAENGIITSVRFVGGCAGNTDGISRLVKGMKVDDVITLLEGTTCGMRPTSCPDQLAKALKQLKTSQA